MKSYPITISIALALMPATVYAAPTLNVQVEGAVARPSGLQLPADARISTAALAAKPTKDAYMLGAALLRNDARREQMRLKAGLMFELDSTATTVEPTTAATTIRMRESFDRMPVTGRVPQMLEPRSLEASRSQDRPALDGDRLIYPTRPATVTVVGAVVAECKLPHVPGKSLRAYIRQCPTISAASREHLFVVQPDGAIEKAGIALWNRSAETALAPGAVIYAPLAETILSKGSSELNEDAVRFLATQVLDAPGVLL